MRLQLARALKLPFNGAGAWMATAIGSICLMPVMFLLQHPIERLGEGWAELALLLFAIGIGSVVTYGIRAMRAEFQAPSGAPLKALPAFGLNLFQLQDDIVAVGISFCLNLIVVAYSYLLIVLGLWFAGAFDAIQHAYGDMANEVLSALIFAVLAVPALLFQEVLVAHFAHEGSALSALKQWKVITAKLRRTFFQLLVLTTVAAGMSWVAYELLSFCFALQAIAEFLIAMVTTNLVAQIYAGTEEQAK